MKGVKAAVCLIVVCLLNAGCEKNPKRLDDFFVEFATVVKTDDKITFKLDNGKQLTPEALKKNYSGENGQRVLLNYTPLKNSTIKINRVSNIFTGRVEATHGIPDQIFDAVNIQSIWVGGNHLNMILDVEYYEKEHVVKLFRDTTSSENKLYLGYSRNGDAPGYSRKVYLSFLISSLKKPTGKTFFTLYIRTTDGQKEMPLSIP